MPLGPAPLGSPSPGAWPQGTRPPGALPPRRPPLCGRSVSPTPTQGLRACTSPPWRGPCVEHGGALPRTAQPDPPWGKPWAITAGAREPALEQLLVTCFHRLRALDEQHCRATLELSQLLETGLGLLRDGHFPSPERVHQASQPNWGYTPPVTPQPQTLEPRSNSRDRSPHSFNSEPRFNSREQPPPHFNTDIVPRFDSRDRGGTHPRAERNRGHEMGDAEQQPSEHLQMVLVQGTQQQHLLQETRGGVLSLKYLLAEVLQAVRELGERSLQTAIPPLEWRAPANASPRRDHSHEKATPARRFQTAVQTDVLHLVPEQGFVVNMTRLTEKIEFLTMLHEFIKSTAIAAITLVTLNGPKQLATTVVFLVGIFVVYLDHEMVFDRLDVADLLEEVNFWPHYPSSDPLQCNRFLQVLTGRSQRTRIAMKIIHIVECILVSGAWCVLVYSWMQDIGPTGDVSETILGCQDASSELGALVCAGNITCMGLFTSYQRQHEPQKVVDHMGEKLEGGFRGEKILVFLVRLFIDDPGELEQLGMQVMVYSLMWLLHLIFNFIYVYETHLSMPFHRGAGGREEVWNLEKHGIPWRFRIFGLPSLWFVSPRDYSKLLCYVNALRPHKVTIVYPEELALVLLRGDEDKREEVANTLKRAKYFETSVPNTGLQRSRCSPGQGDELNLDLYIFQQCSDTVMNVTGRPSKGSSNHAGVNVGIYMHLNSEEIWQPVPSSFSAGQTSRSSGFVGDDDQGFGLGEFEDLDFNVNSD